MILLLIAALLLILFFEYSYFKKEICASPIFFTVPFIVMCVVALLCAKEWNFQMHWNTFCVILGGNVTFFLGAILAQKVHIQKDGLNYSVEQDNNESIFKYFLFFLLQCICYLWKARLVTQFASANGVGGGLSEALKYYDHIVKFTTQATLRMPRVLSIGLDVCTAFGYVVACVLAQKLVQTQKKNLLIVLLNFVVAVLGGLSSGGRALAVRYMIAALTAYLILGFRSKNWKTNLDFKIILRMLICAIAVIAFFIVSRQMVGRGAVTEVGQYLSRYVGAQVYNLDLYLNEAFRESEIFGQETFQPLIQFICSRLGITRWARYNLDLPFVQVAGYNLGNVYTTFYAYIHDFGYTGVIIMPLLFGFVSQIIYRCSRTSSNAHTINLGLVLYSDVAYMTIFSFFSNKFGELMCSVSMIKRIVFMWLILFFLFHIKVRGMKVYIDLRLHKNINIGI